MSILRLATSELAKFDIGRLSRYFQHILYVVNWCIFSVSMESKTIERLYRHELCSEYIQAIVPAGDGGIQKDSNRTAEEENSDKEGEGRSDESSEGQAGGG